MSPKQEQLTPEQQATIRELQAELEDLDLRADEQWRQWIATGDLECLNNVLALDGEIEMKGLVAYVPKKGEKKIKRVRDLVDRVRKLGGERGVPIMTDHRTGAHVEARLNTLDSVNAWREAIGLPELDALPRGIIGDSSECTIARAFQIGWAGAKNDRQFAGVSIGGDDSSIELVNADGRGMSVDFDAEGMSKLLGLGEHGEHGIWEPDYEAVRAHPLYVRAVQGRGEWSTVISEFDDGLYYDLIENDEVLFDVVQGQIDEGYAPDDGRFAAVLEEIERRGLLEQVASRFSELERDESGRWRVADAAGEGA